MSEYHGRERGGLGMMGLASGVLRWEQIVSPRAVCYVGSRGHLLPEDRHLVSLVHHYIVSTYHNAGTIYVLSYVQ